MAEVIGENAMDRRTQRSELSRLRVVAGVFGLLAALVLVRHFVGGAVMRGPTFYWTFGLLAGACLYELVVFSIVMRANRAGRLIPAWRWRANAAAELAVVVGLLVAQHVYSPLGEREALTAPALLVLPLLILLSVLRLKPGIALLTGIGGGVAHAILAVRVHRHAGLDASHLPGFLSYGVLLVITGVAGAIVARRARVYVLESVSETQQLAAAQEEMRRTERDLSMAREIQRALLPAGSPEIAGYDLAGMSRAAEQTGGDYYDWQALPDGRLAVVLADASGHGIAPALVTAVCRAYARASLPLERDPGALLARINALVHADMSGGRFVTFALALLDPRSARVELASAGHGPGLLYRAASGEVQEFAGDGVPLGILPDETYGTPNAFEMQRGDVLLMLTDGFFEWQRRQDGEQFGIARLKDTLRNAARAGGESSKIVAAVDEAVNAFAEGAAQLDDTTIVAIRRTA